MKLYFYSFLGIGAVLTALTCVSAQEPKGKEPPPGETKERPVPKERLKAREGAPERGPRDVGPDGPRERPPLREDGQPPRGGEPGGPRRGPGPGGAGPGGPGFGGPGNPNGGPGIPGGRGPGGDGRGRGPGGFGRGFQPGGFPPGGPGEFFPEDPEMAALNRAEFDLDQQTQELADKLRNAKGEDREKIKTEISVVVTKHFDIRQQRRELQIKRMEDELKKLREAMTKRNESKEQIIKKRLAELVGNEDDLGF